MIHIVVEWDRELEEIVSVHLFQGDEREEAKACRTELQEIHPKRKVEHLECESLGRAKLMRRWPRRARGGSGETSQSMSLAGQASPKLGVGGSPASGVGRMRLTQLS